MMVRPATRSDAGTIAEIGFRAWESAIHLWEDDVSSLRERSQAAYADFARESWATILVAEAEGRLVGWGAREHGDHFISDLWIDPLYQRHGVGGLLMDALEAAIAANGREAAALETHARNYAAIAFYRRRGYEIRWLSTKYAPSLDRDIEKVGMEKQLAEAQDVAALSLPPMAAG